MNTNYNEFKEKLKEATEKELGDGIKASFSMCKKNNGKVEEGIMLQERRRGLELNISIQDFYEIYLTTGDIERSAQLILDDADTGRYTEILEKADNWEEIRGLISARVINFGWNQEMLKTVPYKKFHDLAVCFYITLHMSLKNSITVTVGKGMLERWGKDTEDLWEVAMNNLNKEDFHIWELGELIGTLSDIKLEKENKGVKDSYVLSNTFRMYGAVSMFCTEMLSALAERLEKDLFVIPSSIHEVILIPDDGIMKAHKLRRLLVTVNENVVERKEWLSNELYYFSREKGGVITCEELLRENSFERRLQQGDWWKEGNECLNVQDIHKPPVYYRGTEREWIEGLTAYVYSYPVEWSALYEEYLQKVLDAEKAVLQFYHSEDGYLRKEGVEGVYLKVSRRTESLSHEELNRIGQLLSEQEEELFKACQVDSVDEQRRSQWTKQVEETLQRQMRGQELSVSVVDTLDESEFMGKEVYFDMLNGLYIIL